MGYSFDTFQRDCVSTLLEIQRPGARPGRRYGGHLGVVLGHVYEEFQPFLRFNEDVAIMLIDYANVNMFQPFLRFNGSCGWLLWVFKFFFGFL